MTGTARPSPARRMVLSHALAGVAVGLPWPALLACGWQVSDDPAVLGLLGAARFAPCVLLSAVLGGIGDRIGRLFAVRVSTATRLGLLAVCAAFMLAGSLWPAVIAATLTVAAGVPAFPSLAALIPQVSSRPDRDTNALVTWEISGFVVGPAVGGLLLPAGVGWSVAGCVPLMAAALLVLPRRFADPGPRVDRPRLREGVRQVLALRVVRRAIGTVMMLNAVIGVLGVALLTMAQSHWGAGVNEFGWLTALQGFASLAAPVLIRTVGRLPVSVAAHLLVVLPLVAVAVSPGWVAAAVPLALAGAGLTAIECRTTRMFQVGAPAAFTAVALGIADAALVAAAMAGALLAPWLLTLVGPAGLLIALAAGCAAVLSRGLAGAGTMATRAEPRRGSPRRSTSDPGRPQRVLVP